MLTKAVFSGLVLSTAMALSSRGEREVKVARSTLEKKDTWGATSFNEATFKRRLSSVDPDCSEEEDSFLWIAITETENCNAIEQLPVTCSSWGSHGPELLEKIEVWCKAFDSHPDFVQHITDTYLSHLTPAPAPAECPAEPRASGLCASVGMSCEYGEECCCGKCHPSQIAKCTAEGWSLMHTDACLGSCEEPTFVATTGPTFAPTIFTTDPTPEPTFRPTTLFFFPTPQPTNISNGCAEEVEKCLVRCDKKFHKDLRYFCKKGCARAQNGQIDLSRPSPYCKVRRAETCPKRCLRASGLDHRRAACVYGCSFWVTRGTVGDLCKLPMDQGQCWAAFPAFFFNTATGACEEFVFGGCGGNANNFPSREECENACGAEARTSVATN